MLLRHEEITHVAKGALGFRNCLTQLADAPLGFLDGPLQGVSFFGNNREQFLAQPPQASFSGGACQAAAGFSFQRLQRVDQLWPFALGPVILQPLFGADFVNAADGTQEALFKDFAREGFGDAPVFVRGFVCLVQHDDQIADLPPHFLDQRQLFAGNRRIGAHQNDGSINVRHKRLGRRGIPREDGARSPGVSTKHMPSANSACGENTSTPTTFFLFSGLRSSETYCARSSGEISIHVPP